MSERHLGSADALPPLEKGKLRIYSMLYCPYAQRPRLVLAHKQIPFETVNVNLRDKPSWFWDRNPSGTVPILEQDDKVLYESKVIMDYVDEVYPGPKLTLSDPYDKAKAAVLGEEYSKVIPLFYKTIRSSPEELEANTEAFYKALEKFQSYMPATKFLSGDEVSMLDYFCWPWVERFPAVKELFKVDLCPADRFPKFIKWVQAMGETPGVKETRISTEDFVIFIRGYTSGQVDYDFRLKK